MAHSLRWVLIVLRSLFTRRRPGPVRPRAPRPAAVVGGFALAFLFACGGSDDSAPEPSLGLIPEAVAAVEDYYGAPQEYFEISADLDGVGFIVAVDDATTAEQGRYSGEGEFSAPEPVGDATGFTFVAEQIAFDSDRVFDEIRAELDDPVIVDFAIQGGPNDSVVYDATVASDSGGLLRVLLGPEGQIQGAQAQ